MYDSFNFTEFYWQYNKQSLEAVLGMTQQVLGSLGLKNKVVKMSEGINEWHHSQSTEDMEMKRHMELT